VEVLATVAGDPVLVRQGEFWPQPSIQNYRKTHQSTRGVRQDGEERPAPNKSTALRLSLLIVVVGCAYLFLAHPYWFPAERLQPHLIDRQFRTAFCVFGALLLSASSC